MKHVAFGLDARSVRDVRDWRRRGSVVGVGIRVGGSMKVTAVGITCIVGVAVMSGVVGCAIVSRLGMGCSVVRGDNVGTTGTATAVWFIWFGCVSLDVSLMAGLAFCVLAFVGVGFVGGMLSVFVMSY